jgi:competence protein ComEC
VAVRGSDGKLSAHAGRGSNFELARWLEHDGDGRPPSEAAKAHAFRCDSQGCTARIKGKLLAIAASPAALRDDCAAASIVILKFATRRRCNSAAVEIDRHDIDGQGAHALYIDGEQIRVQTVAQARGARRWAQAARREPASASSPRDIAEEEWSPRGRRAP